MGDAPATVTEVLRSLADNGYDADFLIRGSAVGCGGCGAVVPASDLTVDEVYRFEGPSDPGDEMIVLAITCQRCGRKGTIVSGYGTSTSPEEAEVLAELRDCR